MRAPAFLHLRKFVGPLVSKAEAEACAVAAGWQMAADGEHWRRVVASPTPVAIPDLLG